MMRLTKDTKGKPVIALTVRVCSDLFVIACVLAMGAFIHARAESGVTVAGTEIPWSVISTIISSAAAILTLLLRSSLTSMRLEFNHQMTEALKATLEKGRAEGVLEERHRQETATAAHAAGVAEEKAKTPGAA